MVIARRTSRVTTSVTAETRNDAGTNRREKLSPMVWMGARSRWASSTRSMIRPMVVWRPTALARTTTRPWRTTEPACTCVPITTLIGRVSPVIADWSTIASPSTTSPSTGIATCSCTMTCVADAQRLDADLDLGAARSCDPGGVLVSRSRFAIARRVRRRVRSCRYSPILSSHSTVGRPRSPEGTVRLVSREGEVGQDRRS